MSSSFFFNFLKKSPFTLCLNVLAPLQTFRSKDKSFHNLGPIKDNPFCPENVFLKGSSSLK